MLLMFGAWLLLAAPLLLVAIGACRAGLNEEIGRGFPV